MDVDRLIKMDVDRLCLTY